MGLRRGLFVLGIILMIVSPFMLLSPFFMTQSNPLFLCLSFAPCALPMNSSRSGVIPPSEAITIVGGVRLRAGSDLHVEVNVTGGTSNNASLTIVNSTHTDVYPFFSSIILNLGITGEDTYYVFLNNSDTTSETYSYKVIYLQIFPVNPFFLTLYLTIRETSREARYLYFTGLFLLGVVVPILFFASKKRREEILLETGKALPKLAFDGKDKVFYVCQVCGKEYPCDEEITRSIIGLWEEALNIAKERKEMKVKAKVSITVMKIVREAEFSVKTSEDAGKKAKAMLLSITEDIQRDAPKNLRLCPSCQKWVCKTNCWNRNKGICLTCASQRKEEKQERREATQTIKAKNFCPYCGAKINDPTQTKCSKCKRLLIF